MALHFVLALLLVLVFPPLKGMQKKVEQRANLKFLMATGKKPIECWRSLKDVYGRDAMSQTQVRVWHERFRSGEMSVQDKARSGRPRTVRIPRNVKKLQNTLDNDRRTSMRDLEVDTGLKRSSVHRMMKQDLKVKKVSAKFIPRILMQEQINFRVKLCQENLDRLALDKHLLETIICGDESSIPLYDPETRQASTQ